MWDGGESICLINEPLVPLESVCSMITSQHSAGKFAMEPITTRLATMQHTNTPEYAPVCQQGDAKTGQICIFGSHPKGGVGSGS